MQNSKYTQIDTSLAKADCCKVMMYLRKMGQKNNPLQGSNNWQIQEAEEMPSQTIKTNASRHILEA